MSEWHFVPGYLDYEINLSTHKVRHCRTHKLRNVVDSDGYKRVSLKNKKDQRPVKIATILGSILFGPLDEGMVIRHLNDDRTDDRLINLSPGYPIDNVADEIANGKQPGFTSHRECTHPRTAIARRDCRRSTQAIQTGA